MSSLELVARDFNSKLTSCREDNGNVSTKVQCESVLMALTGRLEAYETTFNSANSKIKKQLLQI